MEAESLFDLEAEVRKRAIARHADALEQMRHIFSNPDNKAHDIGEKSTSLAIASQSILSEFAATIDAPEFCFFSTTGRTYFIAFTEAHLNDVSDQIYQTVKQKMLDGLCFRVKLDYPEILQFTYWNQLWPHVKRILQSKYGLILESHFADVVLHPWTVHSPLFKTLPSLE